MSGLRIERLALANVGVIEGQVDLGEFDPAITLITGENETGKSTTVEALRCALFEKHSSRNQGIVKLQPHGTRLGPEVWVDFVLRGHRYELHKRFLDHAMAELQIDRTTTLTGAEADGRIWACLGASAPGRQGSKRTDMGLWGLLWVSQDEAAFADPAKELGEETRGALHEAIGRLVGQFVGGRSGERVRGRVQNEAARYWTRTTGKATGELASARRCRNAADEELRAIEKALAEVEDQATRHESLRAQIGEIKRLRPRLEEEIARAQRDAADVDRLREAEKRARADEEAARARREAAEERQRTRKRLAGEAERLGAQCRKAEEALGEMKRTLAVRAADEGAARSARGEASAALDETRRVVADTRHALELARRAEKAREIAVRLRKAREIGRNLGEAGEEQATTIGDDTFQALGRMDEARRQAVGQLEKEGTRLAVQRDDGSWWEAIVGTARSLAVPGLGEVYVGPARDGLAEARDRWRAGESAFREALRGAEVENIEEARVRRQEREAWETAARRAAGEIAEEAPEGLDALAATEGKKRTTRDMAARSLRSAEKLREQVATQQAALQERRVDAPTLERLERARRDVDVAQARREAIGTRIGVHALRELEVAVDGEAPRTVARGATEEWTLVRPARLRLGDFAELAVAPGGEGLGEADAALAAAEATLNDGLAAVGADDPEDARREARRWREVRDAIRDTESALLAHAPDGIDALRVAVTAHETELRCLEGRLTRARRANERKIKAEEALAHNPNTADLLARLEKLAATVRATEREVRGLAARLRFGDGAERVVSEAQDGDEAGRRWRLVPGAGGAKADAAARRTELELRDALAELNAADLEEARERWRRGLVLAARIEELGERMAAVAPEGVDALAKRLEGMDAARKGAPDADVETLRREESGATEELAERERVFAKAEAVLGQAAQERASLEGEVRAKEDETGRLRRDGDEANERLASARAEQSDAAVDRRFAQADEALEAAVLKAKAIAVAVENASPDLLEGERGRAQQTLRANEESEQSLREELAGVKALLDKAAAEGRFEEWGEAVAKQSATEERLARAERAAAAARRLADEVERAYAAAQARYLAPVIKKAAPYLNHIRPGTRLKMSSNLGVDKVVRRGTEESFDSLSGGTREQLSVIVRLALARVLAEDDESTPLPLILDDTMGWTDDGRFLYMTRILRSAAKDFQLIVLTCHPGRFERLKPGRTIPLDKLRRAART